MIDSGPHDAKIMIVGQSPSSTDLKTNQYFSGQTGEMLKHMLLHAGIIYDNCYVTCVSTVSPIRGNFKYYYDERPKRPSAELVVMQARVRQKIDDVKPNVVIALGTEALKAITNKQSIDAWRGCILTYNNVKIISTYNPQKVIKNYNYHPIVEIDLACAVKESKTRELKYDPCEIKIRPNLQETLNWLNYALKADRVSWDIETIGKHVRCISLAVMIDGVPNAITIPFIQFPSTTMVMPGKHNIIQIGKPIGTLSNYWSVSEELEILDALAKVIESNIGQKVGHNFISFDAPLMKEEFGFDIKSYYMDTMHAFHLMYSEFPMNLKFVSTIMTNFPNYWSEKVTNDDISEWTYCGYDSICTLVISYKIEKELKEAGMWELYQHINALAITITRVQERGVFIDDSARLELIDSKTIELNSIMEKLKNITNKDFNPASSKQVQELLYNKLNLPVQKKRDKYGHMQVTADETALRKLAVKFPEQKVLRNLIGHRKVSKLISTFLDMTLIDGKMVTSFNTSGTKNGRLSSSKTLWGTGMNLQNIPTGKNKGVTSIRHLFIPSNCKKCKGSGKLTAVSGNASFTGRCVRCYGTGKRVWITADLSQAEIRVVSEILYYRVNDSTLKKLYQEPMFDIHTWMASNFLNKPKEDITYKERWAFGNIPNHSGNYGAGPGVMVTKAAKEEIKGITYKVSEKILEVRHKIIPGLKKWWRWVENELSKSRTLTTCFGRKRIFFGRLDNVTYRDAYAFEPQSIVGDVTNRMLTRIEMNPLSKLDILLQVHDEIDGECDACDVEEVVKELQKASQIPIFIGDVPLIIPLDIEVGDNWGNTIDWKEWTDGR